MVGFILILFAGGDIRRYLLHKNYNRAEWIMNALGIETIAMKIKKHKETIAELERWNECNKKEPKT